MVSIGSKLFQSFRNLKSDAVPRPPRAETERVNITEESTEPADGDDTGSVQEVIVIEPDESSQENEKKGKSKKPTFFSNKKKKQSGSNNNKNEPSSPINTQASGNVINIVNCKDVRWGNEITYNMAPGYSQPREAADHSHKTVKKTKLITQVMNATIKPEHEYIDYISKNLGKNWHSIFRALGFTQGRIETIEIDEARNGVSEARYKLLLDWIRNDEEGTLGWLATLMWEEGEKVIVKHLATIYNNNTSSFA